MSEFDHPSIYVRLARAENFLRNTAAQFVHPTDASRELIEHANTCSEARDALSFATSKALCGYCHATVEKTPEAILAHMDQCDKHPMRALEKRLAALEAEAAELRDTPPPLVTTP